MRNSKLQQKKDYPSDLLPALAVRDEIMFPKHTYPLFVGREKSKLAVEKAISAGNLVFLCFQVDPNNDYPNAKDLYKEGITARILKKLELPDNRLKILVEGIDRANLLEDHSKEDYLIFKIDLIPEITSASDQLAAKIELLDNLYIKYSELNPKRSKRYGVGKMEELRAVVGHDYEYSGLYETAYASLKNILGSTHWLWNDINAVRLHKENAGVFADSIANYCDFSREEKMFCLRKIKIEERLDFVYETLLKKVRKTEMILNAEKRAQEKFESEYKKIFLQEQLREILKEMGNTAPMSLVNPIFRGRGFREDNKLVFVLMPFEEKFGPIYAEIIKPTVEMVDLRCTRADDIYGPRLIIEDIWRMINEARIVIADVTGRNPNVFYEISLCHAVGKDVIILTQSLSDVPFDLRHYRCIQYEDSVKGTKKLERNLFKSLEDVLSKFAGSSSS